MSVGLVVSDFNKETELVYFLIHFYRAACGNSSGQTEIHTMSGVMQEVEDAEEAPAVRLRSLKMDRTESRALATK